MNSEQLQKKFADHVRKGLVDHFPEVNCAAFALYHTHLKSKMSSFLSSCFPLTQEALGTLCWENKIADFLATRSTPDGFVLSLSHPFYHYLLNCKENQHYPYLKDLLQFEYLLIELFYMEDLLFPSFQTDGNRLESFLVFNPEHRLLHLEYPVFRQKGVALAQSQGSYYLLMYRHPVSFEVELMELSALYFSALSKMITQPSSLLVSMKQAADCLHLSLEDLDTQEMLHFVHSLQERGVILGFC